jgi:cyanophycinase
MAQQETRSGAGERRTGRLVIIGGNEDRDDEKRVLRRFVELCGSDRPKVLVLTAASGEDEELWKVYRHAFRDLGAEPQQLHVGSREEANDPAAAQRLLAADGIFMTGGDQKRLLALIGGTALDDAMEQAFYEHGRCIAGTSAGASAMAQHMLATAAAEVQPEKDMSALAAGLGLVERVVIDQHFSERQRLGRLLTVVAQNPYLLGVGIDEDTALIVEPAHGIEVVGDGAVTLIDGRQMSSNFLNVQRREILELIDVKLHLLPAGARYCVNGKVKRASSGDDAAEDPREVPAALKDIVSILTQQGAHSS